jgi:hypothetical protein
MMTLRLPVMLLYNQHHTAMVMMVVVPMPVVFPMFLGILGGCRNGAISRGALRIHR